MVKVKLYGNIRELVGKKKLEFEETRNVRTLIDKINDYCGEDLTKPIDEGRAMVVVNGKSSNLNSSLEKDDQVVISPVAGGG